MVKGGYTSGTCIVNTRFSTGRGSNVKGTASWRIRGLVGATVTHYISSMTMHSLDDNTIIVLDLCYFLFRSRVLLCDFVLESAIT